MNTLEEREHARDQQTRKLPTPLPFRNRATVLNGNLLGGGAVTSRAPEPQAAALRREPDGLQRELFEAAQVQRKLSALRQLRRGSFDIAGEIFPIRYVSGDFLTGFDAGPHAVLAVGDVVGKGLSAAMWFTHMVGLIRIFAGCSEAPAEVASRINSHLATVVQPEPPLTTLFLACCDTRTGELTYCNAGHPAPLLLRQDGSAEWLASGGPVLGAVREAAFANGMTVLDRGDTLVSYSDGILECRNTLGEEFGVERLAQAAGAAAGASANTLLFSVLGAVQDFAAGEPPADDLSLMVVHRLDES